MDTTTGLSRHMKFALMSAGAAGIVSLIMISTFLDMLTLLFLPAVMMMVFVSAYFAFKRRMKNGGALTGRLIFNMALEIGTLTHFYTFAFYLPLMYFSEGLAQFSIDMIGAYLIWTLVAGFISLLMFVWIAVPMYLGIGYLQKSMESSNYDQERKLNESILDDDLLMVE